MTRCGATRKPSKKDKTSPAQKCHKIDGLHTALCWEKNQATENGGKNPVRGLTIFKFSYVSIKNVF